MTDRLISEPLPVTNGLQPRLFGVPARFTFRGRDVRQANLIPNCPIPAVMAAAAYTKKQALLDARLGRPQHHPGGPWTVRPRGFVKSWKPKEFPTAFGVRFLKVHHQPGHGRITAGPHLVAPVMWFDPDSADGAHTATATLVGGLGGWPTLIEKAFAVTLHGKYANIAGENLSPRPVMEAICGPTWFADLAGNQLFSPGDASSRLSRRRLTVMLRAANRLPTIAASHPTRVTNRRLLTFHGYVVLGLDRDRVRLGDAMTGTDLTLARRAFEQSFVAVFQGGR